MTHCGQDICFPFPALLMFWTHASATIFMCTKAQGYLLLLLLRTASAESAISVDKSEFIISQGSRRHLLGNGNGFEGHGKREEERNGI